MRERTQAQNHGPGSGSPSPAPDEGLYDRRISKAWAREMQAVTNRMLDEHLSLVDLITRDGPRSVEPPLMPLAAALTMSAMALGSYDSQKGDIEVAVLGLERPHSPALTALLEARAAMVLSMYGLLKYTGELDFLATLDTKEKLVDAALNLFEGMLLETAMRLREALPEEERTPLPPQWRSRSLVELMSTPIQGAIWASADEARPFTKEAARRVRRALASGCNGTLDVPCLPHMPRRH